MTTDPQAAIVAARRAATAALRCRDLAAAAAAVERLSALQAAATGSAIARALAHLELGDLWSLLMDYEAAQRSYTQALEVAPGEARAWFNRAAVRGFLGRLQEAESDYDRALELAPADAQAYLNRSELRSQTPENNHVAELERALTAGPKSWRQEVPLRYALAKEYEDLGEYAASWSQLALGSRLRRQHLQYDLQQDLATVEWIRQAFPPRGGECDELTGAASGEPIFIIGMPRSGSTLLDRMLGGHTQVYSAGELPDFGAAVVAAAEAHRDRSLSRQELISASSELDPKALGEDYLRRTRPRTGHTPYFTDKLPLNYLYCGLIARALPNARMVHVTRGAMATCYGTYKVLFRQGYPFSYDLLELADYYLGYRRLMAHWQAVLPGRIIEVSYERLVQDPATEAQRLLDALKLPWQRQCLDPESNPAAVATASAAQVRHPIHMRSLRLWRHYERELAPVAARLAAAGIAAEA